MQITENARLQHHTHADAERMIETRCPAGYYYEIAEVRSCLTQIPTMFAVKVYHGEGDQCRFIGYAYDPEQEELR